jgi:hypothetical protein
VVRPDFKVLSRNLRPHRPSSLDGRPKFDHAAQKAFFDRVRQPSPRLASGDYVGVKLFEASAFEQTVQMPAEKVLVSHP